MAAIIERSSQPAFPHHKGVMVEALRAFDWGNSALGPTEDWPASLTAAAEFVLDSPGARLLTWGPEYTVIHNDAYLSAFGSQSTSGLGRCFPDFLPDMWLMVAPQMRAAMSGHGQIVTQLRTILRDDQAEDLAYFRLSFTPIRDQHGLVSGVMQDLVETTSYITKQDELCSENQRFRELFNQAPVFLLLASTPDFQVEYANAAYQALIGGREVVGKAIAEVLPEAVAQGFVELMTQVCASREPMIFEDKAFDLICGPDDPPARRYLDFIYQPIVDADDNVSGILCVGSDATAGHVAREQAERLRNRLEHGSRISAMSTMAATLAHELNQPLTAAGNYLAAGRMMIDTINSAGNSASNAPVMEALELAAQQVHRAGRVVRRAQDLVAGIPAVRKVISVADLIARSIALASAADICATANIEPRLDPDAASVCVDPVQAEQILLNFIRNACEAMKDGRSQELSISSRRVNSAFAEIIVRDSGPGLSAERASAPFDCFTRSTTGGQGLGLSLSRTLVEAHGGSVWARNNPEGGASFGFTMPLAKGVSSVRADQIGSRRKLLATEIDSH